MKIKNSWLILRHFGYDRKLDLIDELFQDSLVISNHASVELKEKAIVFIKKIFNQFNEGGFLTSKSLALVFDTLESRPSHNSATPLEEINKYSNLHLEDKLSMTDWEMFWK